MLGDTTDVSERAIAYAKANKKAIAAKLVDIKKYPPDEIPITVFMAGSPGAGKTESSRNLLRRFSKDSILRIDSDDLRTEFSEYTGLNSSAFQAATSIIADKMQDLAIEQDQSYIFDGTLTNLERSRENIERNIQHGRSVFVLYVYQDPCQAWKFVQARELRDGRHVPKEAFIAQYFYARENVNTLKKEFENQLHVDLIIKNIDSTDFNYRENIDIIDRYIPERYNRDILENLIK